MRRSLRAMVAVIVGGSALLAIGMAQRPSGAQEVPQAKPDEDSRSKDRQALLEVLDEVRVREEVQKMRRDAARQRIQQQVQVSGMGMFGGGMGMGGGGLFPQEGAEEHRKAVERSLEEAEAEYLKTSKELAKITRTRSELERRVGEEPPSRPKGERVANDQIHRVGEVVRQVQDEVASFRQRGGNPRQGTSFLRIGDHILNPDEIVRISPAGERFRIDFTGGEPLILNKSLFEELERRLPIRDR